MRYAILSLLALARLSSCLNTTGVIPVQMTTTYLDHDKVLRVQRTTQQWGPGGPGPYMNSAPFNPNAGYGPSGPPGGNVRPGPGGGYVNIGAGGSLRPGPPGNPFLQIGPPPPKVPTAQIDKFTYAGKGCPPGSVSHTLTQDRTVLTMIFDKFQVSVDPGPLKKDFIKHCVIQIDVDSKDGRQWAIWQQSYRGHVTLDPGVRAARKSVYSFRGIPTTISGTADFLGPSNKDFLVIENVPVQKLMWAPCNRDQTMKIDIFTMVDNSRNTKGKGMLSVDSVDGKIEYKLGLKWQPCARF